MICLDGSTQQYYKTPDGVISPCQFLTEATVQDLEIAGRWGNNRNRNSNATKVKWNHFHVTFQHIYQ
jgi:hypothetical protein